MKILLKLLLFFLIQTTLVFSQKNIDPTPEDIILAKKIRETHEKEDVAILESTENITFGLNKSESKVNVNHTVNEKLMNINSRSSIQKYEFYDSESNIATFAIKYRNNKNTAFYVTDEQYKDNDLFYNDARVKHTVLNFPVQGYTFNYELEKNYKDIKYFTSLYFSEEFFTLKKQIVITVPEWLNVELKEFNFEGYKIEKSQVTDSKNNTIYTFTVADVPAISKEESSPGRSYLYPHILVIAKSYKFKDKEITLFNSSADLYKWYKSLVDLMKDDTTVLKSKVVELTAKAKTDEEKIKNIYYWVQDNIRYIAFEDGIAGFKPDESNHVFENRFGDCKGMANLIKQMLIIAGFDARLTWIGTKHIAYDYKTPSLAVDNHMICTLFLKGKKYFLDGTEKFNSFGFYAERIQNKEVMIEDGDKYIIDKIPMGNCDTNKEIYISNLFLENEKIKGVCSKSFIGESRSSFLYVYNNFKSDKKEQNLDNYLAKNDKNSIVTNVKTSDLKNRDAKLTIDYNIDVENKVSTFDKEMYIDLEYMNEYKSFDLKDRKTDYQFDYKKNFESNVTLAIPAGYIVTKLPTNLIVKEPGFDVSITFQKTDKEIIYKKSFIFKNGEIKASEIKKWNDFNKNLIANYNQQITLSK